MPELQEDFFELYGAWKGEPLSRGDQDEYETRLELEAYGEIQQSTQETKKFDE